MRNGIVEEEEQEMDQRYSAGAACAVLSGQRVDRSAQQLFFEISDYHIHVNFPEGLQ